MCTWADRVHRGVIDEARGRQTRQRRWLVSGLAAMLAAAAIGYALSGGGAPHGGASSAGHASGAATIRASAGVGTVLRDCGAGNDPLRGSYSDAALRAALAEIEGLTSSPRYSTCADAIFRAINNEHH